MIDINLLEGKEAALAARAGEIFISADTGKLGYARFIGFLDERAAEIVLAAAARVGFRNVCFFGGYEGAERVYLGVFPDYEEPNETEYPITAVELSYREADKPSHRDFLGAILALGIKRETIGDILVGQNKCIVFLASSVSGLVLGELSKVGRVGVKSALWQGGDLPITKETREIAGTIGSARLDAVIALVTKQSRGKAVGLISAGAVRVNGCTELSASHPLDEGDRLSIKGYGRFDVCEFGGKTGKGRLHVTCRKYL
ncbi:MAG: hypothetical protein E7487_02860 [Ruminococcaceae bacterium]|nr:hypothetical protein [Oscillospiraceae bacterium]